MILHTAEADTGVTVDITHEVIETLGSSERGYPILNTANWT